MPPVIIPVHRTPRAVAKRWRVPQNEPIAHEFLPQFVDVYAPAVHHLLYGPRIPLGEQLPLCKSCHPVAFGLPIRRNHRKCDAIPARKDLNSVYLTPKSRQVCSTSFEIAG
jgi:hypothetical protein